MRWHYRVRALYGQRMLSRILGILEAQGLQPSYLQCQSHAPSAIVDIVLEADAEKARRVGLLLTRMDRVPSVIYRMVSDNSLLDEELSAIAYATRAPQHARPDLDPLCDFWRTAPSLFMNRDPFNRFVSGHETEVRFCWTDNTLSLLFQCEYEVLNLRHASPDLSAPTDRLWEHDVAEIFIAASSARQECYSEFQVSPRSEWLDVQVETLKDGEPQTLTLQSGFVCEARIAVNESRWLAMMHIPFKAILSSVLTVGTSFRMNLYRSQGTFHTELAWRPTIHQSFHVPASFGTLILVD